MVQKVWSLNMFFLRAAMLHSGKRNENREAGINYRTIFSLRPVKKEKELMMKNYAGFFMWPLQEQNNILPFLIAAIKMTAKNWNLPCLLLKSWMSSISRLKKFLLMRTYWQHSAPCSSEK